MRTKTTLLGAAILAAGALSSMAQSNVYSLNVVGYVNLSLTGTGKYTLIANQLDSGNNVFSNFFQSLPSGTQILKWNNGSASFVPASRIAFGNGWSPAGAATSTLNPGEACFVKTAGTSPGATNTFVGNVPSLTATGGTTPVYAASYTNSLPTGYTLIGVTAPASGAVTGLGLTNVPTGTQLLKWDPVGQSYVPYSKTAFGIGWSPSVPSINVGDGFFIKPSSAFVWTQNFNVN